MLKLLILVFSRIETVNYALNKTEFIVYQREKKILKTARKSLGELRKQELCGFWNETDTWAREMNLEVKEKAAFVGRQTNTS